MLSVVFHSVLHMCLHTCVCLRSYGDVFCLRAYYRLAQVAQTLQKPPGFNRLYVGSLHFNITEAMLNAIFAPFGQVSCLDDSGTFDAVVTL